MKHVKKATALVLMLAMLVSAAAAAPAPKITARAWSYLLTTTYVFGIDDNGKATISGETSGSSLATGVTVGVYVERQKTGGYTAVPGMSWTATGEDYVAIDKERYVDKGYTYRLRVEYSATGPDGTEYDTSYSGSYYYG